MRFEDERYIRAYVRDTTTMMMLSWQARALLWETLRKLDRAGILELGDDGLEALAAIVRMPLEVVEAVLPELLRRKVFELRQDGLLVAPRFIEAQEAKQSDKARSRAYRERARDAARAAALGLRGPDDLDPPPDHADAAATPSPPHIRHVPYETETRRDENVTQNHTASLCAVPSRAVPSRAVGEEHSHASTPPTTEGTPTEKRPKREPRGTRLPEDWQPTPELVARLRTELRVDPIPAVRDFVTYWVNATRNAVKPRWDLAFENWVRKDTHDGKLPEWTPLKPGRTHMPAPDDGPRFTPDEVKARIAALGAPPPLLAKLFDDDRENGSADVRWKPKAGAS